MRMILPLSLAVAMTVVSLPAVAQVDTSGSPPAPNAGQSNATTPGSTNPAGSNSTGISQEEAPPATGSGTRALRPGQNSDGTPHEQVPGNGADLPGFVVEVAASNSSHIQSQTLKASGSNAYIVRTDLC